MKTVVAYAFAFVVLANGIHGEASPEEEKQICVPGSQTKKDCNTCTCSPAGTAFDCTRMVCPEISDEYLNPDGSIKLPHQILENPLLRSKRGESSMSAGLFKNGKAMKFPQRTSSLLRKRRELPCAPNTTRVWECNECRCSPDGKGEICTRRICPVIPRSKRDVPFSCVPNSNFMRACNSCSCSSDGRSARCTLMFCLDDKDVPQISQPKLDS